jgi:hypothetical protein
MSKLRSALLASAFAVTVAAAVTGLSPKGETRETSLDQTCAHETWPAISARCLTGTTKGAVRTVSIESDSQREMRARFAVAFE